MNSSTTFVPLKRQCICHIRAPQWIASSFHHHHRLFFSSKPHLSTFSRTSSRPVLPFLAPRRPGGIAARLRFSTENKEWFRYQMRLALYWQGMITILSAGVGICCWWVREDWRDKLYPSPKEWGFELRTAWREARHLQTQVTEGIGNVRLHAIYCQFHRVVVTLQHGVTSLLGLVILPLKHTPDWESCDFPGFDKGLVQRQPISQLLSVQPLSRIGYDISEKPEPWRRCYVEALMALAKSAETIHGLVRDQTTLAIYRADQVLSETNPYPKPGAAELATPLEQNCVPFAEDPAYFYVHILTTKGLTSRQRIEAAIAYAAWLDHKGDAMTAGKLYHWAVEVACKSFSSANPTIPVSSVVDHSTGVINSRAPMVSHNILTASTALASHVARKGELSSALPIYLSILQTHRFAPVNTIYKGSSELQSIMAYIRSMSTVASMGPAPASGDKPFMRDPSTACEEAGIMVHIGEILFAAAETSNRGGNLAQRRIEGLGWTRDAVGIAETHKDDVKLSANARRQCTQCMAAGLDNWWKMVNAIVTEGQLKADKGASLQTSNWARWTPILGGDDNEAIQHDEAWEQELAMVKTKRGCFQHQQLMEQLTKQIRAKSDWFAFG